MPLSSVAIVVLNWNNADETIACLRSVKALAYHPFYIVVVDNGSTDNSVDRILAAHPEVSVLRLGTNLGYADGNNAGISFVMKKYKPDYVCILNNDTEVAPDFLQRMVEVFQHDTLVGMSGPKMYFYEPRDMVFSAGSQINWRRGELDHRGIWKREREEGRLYPVEEDVDFIIGCGVLVRREVIEKVGLLDSRYFLNFEDVDWAVRIRQAGYKVRYTPGALLWHKVSASLGRGSAQNTYYMTRNSLLFFKTYLNGPAKIRTLVRIILRNIGHVLAWSIKKDDHRMRKRRLYAYLFGFRDAVLSRYGEMSDPAKKRIYPSVHQ